MNNTGRVTVVRPWTAVPGTTPLQVCVFHQTLETRLYAGSDGQTHAEQVDMVVDPSPRHAGHEQTPIVGATGFQVAGTVVRAEDLTGKGHVTRCVSTDDCVTLHVFFKPN